MKALAYKELREVFGIAAVATVCYLALVINLMGAKVFDSIPGMPAGTREVPFTGMGFRNVFGLISVVFAAALGFRQSVWESARNVSVSVASSAPSVRNRFDQTWDRAGRFLRLRESADSVVRLVGGDSGPPPESVLLVDVRPRPGARQCLRHSSISEPF